MKTYIQQFNASSQNSSFSTYKISREINNEADLLARQALAYSLDTSQPFQAYCSIEKHGSQCPVFQALNNITLISIRLLIALFLVK